MNPNLARVRAFRAMLEPTVERLGYELVAIEFVGGQPGRRALRISIDRPGGVGIDDCTKVSRQLSPLLDVEDPIDGAYDLEVSTPGIERPLQRAKDWERFTGCDARVRPRGVDARRALRGRIVGIEGDVITLDVAGELRRYALDDIERAHLLLDLEQFHRLGQGLHPLHTGDSP
jgi:ribosome maturation factor RimP